MDYHVWINAVGDASNAIKKTICIFQMDFTKAKMTLSKIRWEIIWILLGCGPNFLLECKTGHIIYLSVVLIWDLEYLIALKTLLSSYFISTCVETTNSHTRYLNEMCKHHKIQNLISLMVKKLLQTH